MGKIAKKIIAMGLSLTVLTGLVSGCGSQQASSDPTQAPQTGGDTATEAPQGDDSQGDATADGSYPDYSGGFSEKVTIQIPVYDRAFEGWNVTDNYYTQYIQSEFGDKYNVDVQFVAIGRSTEVTDYMQLLASKKAPDIIFHYDMPQALAYYSEGAMQELDLDEIANYAPTYYENLGETIDTYGSVDGGHYFFFGDRPDAYNWVTLIRQDWIEAVGKEMPTNLTELNELFAAWQEAGLGHGGGSLIQNNFTFNYGFRDWPVDEKERALYSDLSVADLTSQATKDFLQNMNYQYNNGLIDKEFYLNTDDASTQADFVAGNAGVYALYLSSNTTVIDSLLKNDPNAKVAILPQEAGAAEGKVAQSRAYWPFGMIQGINSNTSDEARRAIWMYLEWMSQPENLFLLQNGVEGETYTVDATGLAVATEGYEGETKLSNNRNKDYWCLVVESAQYADEELNKQANLLNWAPKGYEYLIEDAYEDFHKNLQYSTPDALFTTVIESVADNKATLNDTWKELYVAVVMASEDQFEAKYAEVCQTYLASGYQAILDEKQAAIDAGLYN